MKVLQILTFLTFIPLAATTQNWEQLGLGTNWAVREIYADVIGNVLYIGGNFKYIGDPFSSDDTLAVNGIAEWNGTAYSPLATGVDYCDNFSCNPILSIYHFQDEIYCNAATSTMSGVEVRGITKWDGIAWHPVGEGLSTLFGQGGNIYSQIIYQDDLLVAGSFSLIGTDTVHSLASWDGEVWYSLNFPAVPESTPFIFAMTMYEGDLYVAGNFKLLIGGQVTHDVARYDGAEWHSVGGGLKGGWTFATDLIVFKGELYISGYILKSEGNAGNMILKLKDEQWVDFGGGVADQINDMVIYNDELYVAGGFDYVGDMIPADNIAKWTGEKWCGLGSIFNNRIHTMEVFNGELYIGGGFTIIDGDTVNNIARYIGNGPVGSCSTPVGLPVVELENRLTISPNPGSSTIQVSVEQPKIFIDGSTLTVQNIVGQHVFRRKLKPGSNSNRVEIDISDWPPGLYLVTLETGGHFWTEKVLVQ